MRLITINTFKNMLPMDRWWVYFKWMVLDAYISWVSIDKISCYACEEMWFWSPQGQKIAFCNSDLVCLQDRYWSQPLAQIWCPLTIGRGQKKKKKGVLFYKPITRRLLHNARYTFTVWADYWISSHLARNFARRQNVLIKTKSDSDFLYVVVRWWNVPSCCTWHVTMQQTVLMFATAKWIKDPVQTYVWI